MRGGVAGVQIEDQAIPKRCGHVAGRQVIPLAEAVGKYRAAAHARDEVDPDFVLIARTDARGAHGGTLHTFAGFGQIRAWEEAYLPPEEPTKYEDSVGHQPTRT